jgi:hypothetical protein
VPPLAAPLPYGAVVSLISTSGRVLEAPWVESPDRFSG